MSKCRVTTIDQLVKENVLEPPMDGNHGEIHPKSSDFVESGIPFIMASDIENGIVDFQHCKYIKKSQADKLRKGFSYEGDVLLTHKATIGRSAIVPKLNTEYIMLTPQVTYYRIKNKDILNNRFLKYYFDYKPFQKTFSLWAGAGSTRAYLGITEQLNLYVQLPEIETQKKIAAVLSALDAKIELNNRINTELEAMAKTLYDYWFVQFDFPFDFAQGKSDKNGRRTEPAEVKPYKSNGGKMVWNAELKREIPEGWEVCELNDIANITMGQSPPGESYNTDGKGMIFFQGCTDFGNRFPAIRQYTSQPARYASEGDILLSVRAPVGTLNISNENCCIGRGLASLNSKDNCISYLWGVMMNLKQIFDRRNVDGTTFGSITKDDLFTLKVIKPTHNILKKYQKIVKPPFEEQNRIELENQQLSSLRDFLLPMLMNGQVKVS